MREDLIERLRLNAQRVGASGAADLLLEAADALEAAREDGERYRWLACNAESLPYPDMWRDKEWLDAAIDLAKGTKELEQVLLHEEE